MAQVAPSSSLPPSQAAPPAAAASAPPAMESGAQRPKYPALFYPHEDQLYQCRLLDITMKCELHISTGFVNLRTVYRNLSNATCDCLYALPLQGTVTHVSVKIGSGRNLETVVMSSEEVKQAAKRNTHEEKTALPSPAAAASSAPQQAVTFTPTRNPYDEYVPNLFRLPISRVEPNDEVTVVADFIEPLAFFEGFYQFSFAMSVPASLMLSPGQSFADCTKFLCSIHSVTPGTRYFAPNHSVEVIKQAASSSAPLPLPAPVAAAAASASSLPPPSSSASSSEMPPFFSQSSSSSSASSSSPSSSSAGAAYMVPPQKDKSAASADTQLQSSSASSVIGDGRIAFELKPLNPFAPQLADVQIAYSIVTDRIQGTIVAQDRCEDEDQRGAFCMFVTPPASDPGVGFFARNLIFLLDRSGSMVGDPFHEAVRAVSLCLEQLHNDDKFTIVMFDHQQLLFRPSLIQATRDNIEQAKLFITASNVQPDHGGTDIYSPLSWAIELLQRDTAPNSLTLPFVFLFTDGCVEHEREICKFAKMASGQITSVVKSAKENLDEYIYDRQSAAAGFFGDGRGGGAGGGWGVGAGSGAGGGERVKQLASVRILTLGIGSYCNWFFLKMLSQIGRGYSDVVVFKEKIFEQSIRLLAMASVPLLTDVTISMYLPDGNVELYPFPIPDLYLGAPLTIAGRYSGTFPNTVFLEGLTIDRSRMRLELPVIRSSLIPAARVFLKQRLDLLTAKAWLEDSPAIRQEVIQLSCAHSMPSAYTSMVAFDPGSDNQGDFFDPKAETSSSTKKALAALAVGGAFVVGATAFSFGDAAATLGNIPVVEALTGLFGGDLTACCCCCEQLDCCFTCLEALGDCNCAECFIC